MGRAIFYCVTCSKRLSDGDLEQGKALRAGDRIVCLNCATPADHAAALPTPKPADESRSSRKVLRATPPDPQSTSMRKSSSTRTPVPQVPTGAESANRRKLYVAGGVGGALVLLLGVVLTLGAKATPARSPDPPAAGSEGEAARPEPTGVEKQARHELDKAREYARANPGSIDRLSKIFNDIIWNFEGTETAKEAAKELERLKSRIQEAVAAEKKKLDDELEGPLRRKEFEQAKTLLGLAAGRLAFPEWPLLVGRKLDEVRTMAKAHRLEFDAQREAAELAKPPDKPAEVPLPAASLSAELKTYRQAWESAMAKATARDYAAAAGELRGASAALKEEPSRAESERDLADLLKVEALHREALESTRRKTRGSGFSLEARVASGEPRRISGAILQIDAERVEIRDSKGPVFVEWADVTPASLARSIAGKGPEPRTLAFYCLLEGEAGPVKDLPAEEKWRAYASTARAKLPKVDGAERVARELFYAAEREYRSMETRLQASEKYRSLKTDYSASGITRLYLPRIQRRGDSGRDYYFAPPAFHSAGTFRLGKSGRLESLKDSDPNQAIENQAAIEFAALPNTVYRMWLLAGGCCEETFSLLYQASELTDVHPTTKKKIACDPGGNFAASVKHSIRGLKKTHLAHSPKKEPKRAERWEWIEVKLPKFSTPGLKKVVLMTDQGGFAIGGAWVSSTSVKPPPEADLKELEKARLEDDPAFSVDPDLVGHWTFDDGSGTKAVDFSGNGNEAVVSGARWVEGKIGGALKFEAKSEKVEVPDHESLSLTADFTVAFWMRKDAESQDWVRLVGKGEGNERTFGIWQFEGMGKRIKFQQAGGGQWFDIDTVGSVETGQWAHLGVTIKGARGTIYLNGVKDSEKDRAQPPPAGKWPLTFGSALLHGSFNGGLDDVRLYKRALNAEEMLALYELGR